MSFLGLAFLFGLPLALSPILLHLFDRQRQVVIEWGAMQFLVEAARRKTSSSQMQQWLLLLMRTMAIFCLVMALARPLINSHWLNVTERRETILVIDNSMSMLRSNEGTSCFQSAIQNAVEELDRLSNGDSARVLLASPFPIWITQAAVSLNGESRQLLREQLSNQQPTLGRSDLLAAMFTAVQAESTPGTRRRRVVILTDGQAVDWSTDDTQGWQQFRETLRTQRIPADFHLINVGTTKAATANLAINGIRCNRTQAAPDQPVTMVAQIQNYGVVASDLCSLEWKVANETRHQDKVPALAPGEKHEVVWKESFSATGVYAISAETTADQLLVADNRESVILEVVEHIPVLVIESAPDAIETQRDAFFLQAALGWVDGQPLGSQGVYEPTLVTPDQLNVTELHKYQAILIPNLSEISESAIRSLRSFVSEGGGLWIALGPRTDIERFNQYFFDDGAGLAPLSIDRIVDESAAADQKRMIDPFVGAHPAMASLTDSSRLDIDRIAVSRRFQFSPSRPGEEASILFNLNNGDPLVVEKLVGRGRVIVQAVPLKLQWSELARAQAFVVIVQDWLNYLTQPRATRHNLSPGDSLSLHLSGNDVQQATLRIPNGDDVELTADSTTEGVVFRTSRTSQPGDYSLEVGLTGDKIPFHVQREVGESNLTPLTSVDRQLIADSWGIPAGSASQSLSRSTPSDPIWPLLLGILICLMLAELLLSGSMSRKRFGDDPIAETTEILGDDQSLSVGQSITNKPLGMGEQTVAHNQRI